MTAARPAARPAAATGARGDHADVGVGPHLAGTRLRDGRGALRLRRAWAATPAAPGALTVEAVGDDGRVVALHVAGGRAEVVHEDRRLPGLRSRHARAGVLRAHRAGRRAVLAVLADGAVGADGAGEPRVWVKVARPAATTRAASTARVVEGLLRGVPAAPVLPAVLEVDAARGVLVLSPLPGADLATLLRDPARQSRARWAGDVVGRLLAGLAAAPVAGAALPVHDLADEAGVLTRAVGDAVTSGVVRGATARRLVTAAGVAADALGSLPPLPPVLAHRDLHDGQVLLPDGDPAASPGAVRPGLLDLDTAALADPALDAGNLLAHLDLAAATGHAGAARAVAAGLVARLDVDPRRLQVLRRAAALRLCAVHAYRPAGDQVLAGLLAGAPRVAPWD